MKQRDIKAWAVIIKNTNTQKDDLFMSGESKDRQWARILRTKKMAKELYPDKKIIRIEIKI